LVASALLLGALSSSWLMAFVVGGWKRGTLGYLAWTLMPYAVLLVACIGLCRRGIHPPVRLLLVWAIVLASVGGPLLYIDAMFVHVDAQGALAVLMVPPLQTAIGLLAVVAALVWQWRIGRSAAMSAGPTQGNEAPHGSARQGGRQLKRLLRAMLISVIVMATLSYVLISMLQRSDAKTIETAREVDRFVDQYCRHNNSLPTSGVLKARFPHLTADSGWFFFTDDKNYLRMQYPMQWWNRDAPGEPRISEFTATPYAYGIDYKCEVSQ
jgi:hypothetical protein